MTKLTITMDLEAEPRWVVLLAALRLLKRFLGSPKALPVLGKEDESHFVPAYSSWHERMLLVCSFNHLSALHRM